MLRRLYRAIQCRSLRKSKWCGYSSLEANRLAGNVIVVLRQLGFHDAAHVSRFSPSGRHLLQDATGPALTSAGEPPSDAPQIRRTTYGTAPNSTSTPGASLNLGT